MIDKNEITDRKKHITQLWSARGRGRYTRRESMYKALLLHMLPDFQGGSVLEIGPGTGEFAARMFEDYDCKKYTILDLEENISDSKQLLDSKGLQAEYVVSQDFESLFKCDFDLLISNVCLPETPPYYREALLDNVLPNCLHALVIGGDGGQYDTWIKKTFEEHFKAVKLRDTGFCKTFAISGSQE